MPVGLFAAHFTVMNVAEPTRSDWYVSELGPAELGSAVLFLVAAGIAAGLAVRHGRRLPGRGLLLVVSFAAAALFVGLEELSYGQHLLGWASPEYFERANVQHETNLHNLYSQRPQRWMSSLGEAGIVMIGLVLPAVFALLSRDAYDPGHWPRYICPRWELAMIAALTLLLRAVKELAPHAVSHKATDEFTELLWAVGALLLVLVIRRRVRAEEAQRDTAAAGAAKPALGHRTANL